MSYELINVLQSGESYDLSQFFKSIKWGGDIRQTARKLSIELPTGRDYYLPKYQVPLGSVLMLRSTINGEIIRAVVFDKTKNTDGNYSVTSYNHLIYFLKNKSTYKLSSITATAFIKKLCSDFGVSIGSMADTGIVLEKLILRDKTLYDMAIIALTETAKRNGKKYMLQMSRGKLNVIEKGKQVVRWLITEGQNLIDAEYSENINETKNSIIIVGDKDEVLAEVKDSGLIKQYGILQEMKKESNISSGEAKTIASNMLKDLGKITREASLNCLGIDSVEAGTAIEVKETITGLTGTFYVDTDDHDITNGQHTMNLKLNWTDEVVSSDYQEAE